MKTYKLNGCGVPYPVSQDKPTNENKAVVLIYVIPCIAFVTVLLLTVFGVIS